MHETNQVHERRGGYAMDLVIIKNRSPSNVFLEWLTCLLSTQNVHAPPPRSCATIRPSLQSLKSQCTDIGFQQICCSSKRLESALQSSVDDLPSEVVQQKKVKVSHTSGLYLVRKCEILSLKRRDNCVYQLVNKHETNTALREGQYQYSI